MKLSLEKVFFNHFVIYCLGAYISGIIWAQHNYGLGLISFVFLICSLFFSSLNFLGFFKITGRQKPSGIYGRYLGLVLLFFLAFFYTDTLNKEVPDIQKNLDKTVIWTVKVLEPPLQKNNKIKFLAKVLKNKQKILIYAPSKNNTQIKYGDILEARGRLVKPDSPANPGEFNYQQYLKYKQIAALLIAKDVKFLKKGYINPAKKLAYFLKERILVINNQTLPYPYSDIYTGFVFGEHGTDLPDEISENFQKVGLTHLLVVSGAQVALLSGILLTIFQRLNCNNRLIFILISMANIIFYFLTGGGASIFRAVLMNELVLGLKTLQRKTEFYHVFALTALVMLVINPFNLYDVGAQLSFMATFALIFGVPCIQGVLPAKLPVFFKDSLAVSLAPFILTTPIIWFYFNNISLVSLISNLLVINFAEILVVVGFFSSLIGFVFLPLTQILNNFSYLLLVIINRLVDFLAGLPLAQINLKAPHWSVVLIFYFFIIYLLYEVGKTKEKPENLRKKTPKRRIFYLGIGLSIFLFLIIVPAILPQKYLKVTFLDVGQGDAILIECPNRKTILIDAGMRVIDFRTGKVKRDSGKMILSVLKYKGINKLDMAITTHFHLDHWGGMPYLFNNLLIGLVLDNNHKEVIPTDYLKSVEARNITRFKQFDNQKIKLAKDIELWFIYPFKDYLPEHNENNNSLVVRLSYKDIDFLFTGDLEKEKEILLANIWQEKLDSEVLKLGHHGSNTSSSSEFLNMVKPELAIICVGNKNKFGHPSKKVLQKLRHRNIKFLRTDQSGAIEIITDGKKIFYKSMFNKGLITKKSIFPKKPK